MKKCIKETVLLRKPCGNTECRMHIDYAEDLNCTSVAIMKHGSMTLEEIGKRHSVSTVRAKQLVDAALLKLKKRLKRENTI
tara:strand:- start:258 stop:500 length:243 start_codon:yes stop_codon:yes gene_type:complete